ncbi:MAG TPA: phosphate ABC transporter ATP-binding protein [Deltaproteobacteria bacterium]|nr:phosphate ABC transporter ATP-binding protein [Deltaproteobacteria bacterium]
MQTPVISMANLSVAFFGRTVLNGIDLEIPGNSITIIIGPSGSGKTTLLRAVNRLNEEFAGCSSSGTIWIEVSETMADIYADLHLSKLRRVAGMVFQSPNVFPLSIRKNLLAPLKVMHSLSRSQRHERMEQALKEAELWDEVCDRLDDSALTLSGGQQQRLCLARALALSPRILLLDEPTASLDVRSAAKIEELLMKLKERYTILAVSHSIRQVKHIADRAVILSAGQMIKTLERRELETPGLLEGLVDEIF